MPIQHDRIVQLEAGEVSVSVAVDGKATVTLQAEGEGGREVAKAALGEKELRGLARAFAEMANAARDNAPRPQGCSVEAGRGVWRCPQGRDCPCALRLMGV